MTYYRTLTTCYHTKDDRLIGPGERIDLGHLTPDERLLLVTMQPPAVEEVADEQPAPGLAQEEA